MNEAINGALEVVLGQVPEAIYFALFMICTKRLKEKRILFVILMVVEYLLLKYFIKFNIWFQISYTIITYLILKLLYKDKSQITDIFILVISYLILGIFSFISYFLIKDYIIACIICRIFMFLFLFFSKNKLNLIQYRLYKVLWNRNDIIKKKIKSTTFRCINLFVFNIAFILMNLAITYCNSK